MWCENWKYCSIVAKNDYDIKGLKPMIQISTGHLLSNELGKIFFFL